MNETHLRSRIARLSCLALLWTLLSAVPVLQAAPAAAAGAADFSIKDTAYSIPSGAKFVAPNGSDGNSGTKTSPWKTLEHATKAASSGSTIVLRAGNYRESVYYYGKRLTIQPYPHEKAWLLGSVPVTGWKTDGNAWRRDNWTYKVSTGSVNSRMIDSSNPLAARPEMVFIDQRPLRQVGSRSAVSAGEFYVDYSNKRLYIGDNPSNRSVDAAVLPYAMNVNSGHGSVIRGLGIAHYATSLGAGGTFKGNANQLTLENNTFTRNATQALTIYGTNAVVRGNSFTKNGQLGLTSHKGHGLVGEGNRFAENNYERFAISYQAGAVKLSNTKDSVWRNNLFEWNYGKGLWLDRACYNVKVVGNTIRHNQALGISLEISSKLLVASNVITDNGTFGIHVNESRDVDIYNNTLDGNERAIRVWEGKRPEDVADVVVKNNLMSRSSEANFTADDWDRRRSAEKMGVTENYNGYYRPRTSSPAVLIRWARYPSKALDLKSLSQFRSATAQGDNSREWGNVSDPFYVNAAAGDYRLRSSSAARGIGSPLPSAVASAIGVASGQKVDLGALRW